MTAAATVVLAIFARGLLAGYGGSWFFPVLASDAARAALPFVALAVIGWIWGVTARRRTLVLVAECVFLFAQFGDDWIAPHTPVARLLGAGPALESSLVGTGIVAGIVLGWLSRRFPRLADPCIAAIAGWLILGPPLYARFDTLEAGGRLLAALAISGCFAALALVLASSAALLGPRAPRLTVLAGMAAALVAALAAGGPHPESPRDSIVLVIVDTLRADMVNATLPSGAPLMPHLQAIAHDGVRFTTAVAPSPWTIPSTVSILSGMNPYRHRVGRMAGYVPLPGDPAASHLGATLRAAGYQVAGFVNNPYLRPYYGFGRGFLRFRRYHGNARDGTALARAWAAQHAARPFVLVLHLMDPHWPYEAPPGFGEPRQPCPGCDSLFTMQYVPTAPTLRAEVRRRYKAEVAFTDAAVGELYDDLRANGGLAHTWFVIAADHGEELWDHLGFLHGHTLYDELLRVPLVIVPPSTRSDLQRARVIETQVRLEDVAPTLLDIAGVALRSTTPSGPASDMGSTTVPALDGVTLLPLLAGDATAEIPRPVVAGFLQTPDGSYAVRTRHYKLVYWPGVREPTLFDLATDPGETTNVSLREPAVAAKLLEIPAALGLVPTADGAPRPAPPARIGGDIERELRSLGYVQ